MADLAAVVPQPVRCAIYTRKSSEEGLDKEFNSLAAQREAAEAFIASQRREGWSVIAHRYDDGGFTGANMERPALARLMSDIEARKIDCVVVYKVDRLSRSLLDFARMMGLFEQHDVSFVSVTQQFNTRSPVGRLTLNILLSFAQFERDIISERTRDNKAAAKRKGKWTGGYVPLGYDLDPQGGKLVLNEIEAEQVRAIFDLFAANGSLAETLDQIQRRGWRTKSWQTRNAKQHQGACFTQSSLGRLLANELYVGSIVYKEKVYRGEHPSLISIALFRKVQRLLSRVSAARARKPGRRPGLLCGILHCGHCGQPMTHVATERNGRRYRYYVCRTGKCRGQSAAAEAFEDSVIAQLESGAPARLGSPLQLLGGGAGNRPGMEMRTALSTIIERITYDRASGEVRLRLRPRKEQQNG